MRTINIHPFPARMASDLALIKTKDLASNSLVLDPMAGSGTVIQAARQNGHRCIGLDVDPLAVLMTKVATKKIDEGRLDNLVSRVLEGARNLTMDNVHLPWFDAETEAFSKYWFAPKQRRALKKIAHVLHSRPSLSDGSAEANVIRIGLSRLIVTKESGASLARDVSHSRPHRVADENDFDVFFQFEKSIERIKTRLNEIKIGRSPTVRMGDARVLPWIRDASVDMIMTSPPYLNAIDYMRGHRMSLIWLGYSLSQLREIRSNSIGSERAATKLLDARDKVRAAFGKIEKLPVRHQNMVDRYALDLFLMMTQSARVLKRQGCAVFVVGNSCLKDVFISNARGLEAVASLVGLELIEEHERDLPAASRYLPMPADNKSSLGRRMRTETVMTFIHAGGIVANGRKI